MSERKQILLRLDPAVHDALARWAGDELRSTNAQIEYLLRQALLQAGRLPDGVARLPRRGRPPKSAKAQAEQVGGEADAKGEPGEAAPGTAGGRRPGPGARP